MTFEDVRDIVHSIQGVEDGTSYGTPALKIGGALMARKHEEPDWLVVRTTFEERDELMAADPDTYFVTDHYLKYPWVLVRLSRVHRDAVSDLLRRAARLVSAAKSDSTKTRRR